MRKLYSPAASKRLEGVRTLAKYDDDEAWAALTKSARDGAALVRAETAAAMAAKKRADAPDAISPLLRDPEDSVRIAAARAMPCGERGIAYLLIAFSHGDAAVRSETMQALQRCAVRPDDVLAHEEAERRRKVSDDLASPPAAIRARGARELGMLGRDEDKQQLMKLLDERDGVVVAAAARALGEAGASEAVPRLVALLDERGEVAAAAAEALLDLNAVEPARSPLAKLAVLDSDEAVPAAAALGRDCALALKARNPHAVALLADGCPAAPFVKPARIDALLHAQGDAPGLDKLMPKLLQTRDPRIPRVAERYRQGGAAIVALLQKDQAERAKHLEAGRRSADDEGSAAEIAKAPTGKLPDKQKYALLMERLKEKAGAENARTSAAARLGALLKGDATSDQRDFLAACLRAALALKAPGADAIAAKFAQDPDPLIASAARGEPEPAPRPVREKPPDPWSDDGAVRARACPSTPPDLRRLLAARDPERRVRVACGSTNETTPGK